MFVGASLEKNVYVLFEKTEGVFGFVSGLDPTGVALLDLGAGKICRGAAARRLYGFNLDGVIAVIGKYKSEGSWRTGGHPAFKLVNGFVPRDAI